MDAPRTTWQSLVDEQMIKPHNCTHAVIYQIDSKQMLAGSPGYWLPEADFDRILKVFKDPVDTLINGLELFTGTEAEMRFIVPKADARSFYAKRGATSCFGARSNNILIVCFTEPLALPARTANLVEQFAADMIRYNL